MEFETAARTDVGRRRKVNEDAILDRPDLGLWAVADGMGGHRAGDVASALVVEVLGKGDLGRGHDQRQVEAAGRLSAANDKLIAMRAEPAYGGGTIGSTVVALLIEGDRYACLWAGDSRAYLRRAGELFQLTCDHSLVQRLVDAGELSPDQAKDHPNANIVTRAVGAERPFEVDAVEGDVRAGDTFLLASDGLTRMVGEDEIEHALSGASLDQIAGQLIATTLDRGAPDNVSVVLVRPR
jgi:serine/threonine protein phosphatase PrpC